MIYIRNCSNRVIHLAEEMLLPDQKVKDVNPHTGKTYSELPVIKLFIEKGMLELVDVRPAHTTKAAEPVIKVEIEDVPEEDETSKAPVETSESEVNSDEQDASKKKPASTRGRKKKES